MWPFPGVRLGELQQSTALKLRQLRAGRLRQFRPESPARGAARRRKNNAWCLCLRTLGRAALVGGRQGYTSAGWLERLLNMQSHHTECELLQRWLRGENEQGREEMCCLIKLLGIIKVREAEEQHRGIQGQRAVAVTSTPHTGVH